MVLSEGMSAMPIRLDEDGERYSRERDDVVLEQLRAGDESAFLMLVDRYAPAMHKIARAYVRDDATAEDVVQEAWLGVLRGLATFEGRGSLRGWIFTIVVNRAKTRGVREARSVPFSALVRDESERDDPSVAADRFAGPGEEWPRHWRAEPESWGARPEERLMRRELRERIDAAIDALPPAQRTVVLLRDIAGQPTAEVCNVLELSETNARVLLHRARAKIRRSLDPYLAGGSLA
jgi:RNA polymerase sigma-70 factor (ECF subfamily)